MENSRRNAFKSLVSILEDSQARFLLDWAILVIFGALYLLFLFPSPEYNAYNKDDAGFFVTLGLNLAKYGRYTVDTFPLEDYGRHATWPFVFPGILAGVISVFGISWIALKVLMVTFGIGNLFFLQKLWPGCAIGRWAVILTGVCPGYFLFSHTTMTEIPYMLTVTLTLIAIGRSRTILGAFGAGFVALVSFLTRGYSITFLPAGVLFYLLLTAWPMRQRWFAASAFAIPFILGVLVWTMYTSHTIAHESLDSITNRYGNGLDFLKQLGQPPVGYARLFYWYHLRQPLHFILPVISVKDLSYDPLVILTLGIFGLSFLGWLHRLRQGPGILELWMPFAICFLLFVVQPSVRYWLTFVPFLFYYSLCGTDLASRRFKRLRYTYPMFTGSLLICGLVGLSMHLTKPDELRFHSSFWRDYRDLAIWARSNLPEKAVIVAPYPNNFYSVAVRRTFNMSDVDRADCLPQELAGETHLYIIRIQSEKERDLTRYTEKFCLPLIKAGRLEMVHQEGQVSLYVDTNPGAHE